MRRSRFFGILLLPWLLAGCFGTPADRWVARQGVLDLRSYDFTRAATVPLNGEWDFVAQDITSAWGDLAQGPRQTRTVPDLWKDTEAGGKDGHGAGTYHLTVLLPEVTPPLAIRFLSASTAFRLEAQGQPLIQVGVPSLTPEGSQAAYRPGFVRLPDVGSRVDLTVRVSNHTYRVGGLWYPFDLGRADFVETNVLNSFSVTLGQSVALGTVGVILIVLFLFRVRERPFLYSGLIAFVLALRVLLTGDYVLTRFWPALPFDLVIRGEYLSVFAAFPLAVGLFPSLMPQFLSKKLARGLLAASLLFVALPFFLPLDLLTRTINGFYLFAGVFILVYLRAFWIQVRRRRDRTAVLLAVAALVLALSIVNDVFYSSFLWNTGNLAAWGFLFFILTLVWIDFQRLTSAFSEVENLVVQKDLLLMEIHHRVRNNLQMVAGLVSLQAKRLQTPEAKEAMATLRSRVLAMALVHDKLFGKVESETLDLGDYIQSLVELQVPAQLGEDAVQVSVKVESVEKPVKLCLDVGIVVTELINNSLKHALLPRGGGKLNVELSTRGTTVLILVEDDGPGFAERKSDTSKSLGYKLIGSLLGQHHGSCTVLQGPGGRVLVRLE